ncbi:alkylation response protein AidB-like acyl-CoA dehydrogenase [Nocardia sp. GAS34]|uniref:hypothetical protein n=1 Tax=unclassified Nocardia TaxID=2637762 RepID=UPI003D1F5857
MLDEAADTAERIFTARVERLDAHARIPLQVVARSWTGQILNLMMWWLEAGTPYTAGEMARMAHELALHGHLWAQGFSETGAGSDPARTASIRSLAGPDTTHHH